MPDSSWFLFHDRITRRLVVQVDDSTVFVQNDEQWVREDIPPGNLHSEILYKPVRHLEEGERFRQHIQCCLDKPNSLSA